MNAPLIAPRQGLRLLQISVALLLFTSLLGFAIPYVAAPQLGLAAHKLGGLQSILLMAMGLAWPRLNLNTAALRIAFWFFIYAAFAILVAYLLGAIWGAGNETMSLGGGTAHGSAFQEGTIRLVAYSCAPTGLISFALVLWGLCTAKT
jgi:(hydroxyamino)benzene mutase